MVNIIGVNLIRVEGYEEIYKLSYTCIRVLDIRREYSMVATMLPHGNPIMYYGYVKFEETLTYRGKIENV